MTVVADGGEMGINNSNFSPYLSLIDAPQPAHVFSADSGETRSFNILISPALPLPAPLLSPVVVLWFLFLLARADNQ